MQLQIKDYLVRKAKRLYKQKNILGYFMAALRFVYKNFKRTRNFIIYQCYYKHVDAPEEFSFQDRIYQYFYHHHNATWRNERAVEIPIVWSMVQDNQGKDILEVGNTLPNYFRTFHDILDKYDKSKGVINEDVVDFMPNKKYDLIVSISTLEHVGWEEEPCDNMKIFSALENLKELLKPEGKLVVTLPLGTNAELDTYLREGRIGFDEEFYFKRLSKNNRWEEVNWKGVKETKNNEIFPATSMLMIGVTRK